MKACMTRITTIPYHFPFPLFTYYYTITTFGAYLLILPLLPCNSSRRISLSIPYDISSFTRYPWLFLHGASLSLSLNRSWKHLNSWPSTTWWWRASGAWQLYSASWRHTHTKRYRLGHNTSLHIRMNYIISHHITSDHITPYHIASDHIISHLITLHHITSHRIRSEQFTPSILS